MKTLLLDAAANFASVPGSGAVDDIFVFTNFNQGQCAGIHSAHLPRHNSNPQAQ
jgi:hypothetical protein